MGHQVLYQPALRRIDDLLQFFLHFLLLVLGEVELEALGPFQQDDQSRRLLGDFPVLQQLCPEHLHRQADRLLGGDVALFVSQSKQPAAPLLGQIQLYQGAAHRFHQLDAAFAGEGEVIGFHHLFQFDRRLLGDEIVKGLQVLPVCRELPDDSQLFPVDGDTFFKPELQNARRHKADGLFGAEGGDFALFVDCEDGVLLNNG